MEPTTVQGQWLVQFQLLNAPSTFENITTPRDLHLEVEVAWELLKTTLNMNKKEWSFNHRLCMP
jgi:hypothetical protein